MFLIFVAAEWLYGGIRPVRFDRGHVRVSQVGGHAEILRLHRHTGRISTSAGWFRFLLYCYIFKSFVVINLKAGVNVYVIVMEIGICGYSNRLVKVVFK